MRSRSLLSRAVHAGTQSPPGVTTGAEGTRLIPVDRASATPRPDNIGETYLELEHRELGAEQEHLYAAEGEQAARRFAATAHALDYAQCQARESADRAKEAADKARAHYEQTRDLLGVYVRRKSTSSVGYMARLGGLLIGDVAGLTGAAIALGEYPALAVTQAVSAGTATITAGLAGTELRHRQDASNRRRRLDDLPKVLDQYRHLFDGGTATGRLTGAVWVIATLVAIFVSVGVFALRTAVEGPLAGVTFGALAAAIAMASFINSWYHADAVADVIESAYRKHVGADRRHRRLAGSRAIKQAESATAQGRSIIAEHDHRGRAASARIAAMKYRALLASPDVVGHGPPVTRPGLKPRRGKPS
ncbi:hypothetical protein CQY20_28415 [Mycolicibacterium agri]|nr:hypothetical protein [Mycolicibacterium agri]PEG33891.1 hypothetical protein CQY20_28415 [Mycolicibacterium agri]